ncbi:hypothetical protein [Rufibacter tibetensis]|uniref:Lipoprotein n=1 Tax=Rufibacter tibetensis TaxID=512763 RepID=A0A0P0CH69_9BACT|nr:hypothetical protein [Rufibacter tibetensis]ALI98516.1 hypothetical protein DC20_05430 [Rufibacter tibetensis]
MKRTLTIFLVVIIASCARQQETVIENVETVEKAEAILPLRVIKKNSIERPTHFNMDSIELEKLKAVDSTFFKSYLAGLEFNNDTDAKVEFDRFSRYYFFDYKELDNFFLFSIIHDDEVGYSILYHFTYDKAVKRISSVDYIGATGGDGGHGITDRLRYNIQGDSLLLTSISTYDRDFSNKGFTREYDSIVTRTVFNKGKAFHVVLDSIRRTDTIWRANKK